MKCGDKPCGGRRASWAEEASAKVLRWACSCSEASQAGLEWKRGSLCGLFRHVKPGDENHWKVLRRDMARPGYHPFLAAVWRMDCRRRGQNPREPVRTLLLLSSQETMLVYLKFSRPRRQWRFGLAPSVWRGLAGTSWDI